MQKITHAKGHIYEYEKWYIFHRDGKKERWCYLPKKHLERPEIKRAIRNKTAATQIATQKITQNKEAQNKSHLVRGVGFEPTNPFGTAASGLRLWPCLATPA